MSTEKCSGCGSSADWVCIACRSAWCKKCTPLQSVNGVRQKTCPTCQGEVVLAAWKPVEQSDEKSITTLKGKLGVGRKRR